MRNFFIILLSVIISIVLFYFFSAFFNEDNGERFAIAILIGVVIALQCIILKKLSGINQTK